MSGLQIEAESQPDFVKIFREHTLNYVRYRKNQETLERAGLSTAQCQPGTPLRNPFCDYFGDDWKMTVIRARMETELTDPLRPMGYKPSRSEAQRLKESIQKGDLSALDDASEYELRRAMRSFDDTSEVLALSAKTLGDRKCPSSALLFVLGSRLEESFPDDKAVDMATQLYSRADSCSRVTDPSAMRARYRLGLLHLMHNDCDKAEPVLKRLSEFKSEEGMVARAFYWLGWCSEQRGDPLKREIYQNRLVKWNPLGFHTVELGQIGRQRMIFDQFMLNEVPTVMMRSELKPELNGLVRVIEAIEETRSETLAKEMLTYLRSRSINAEPEFQLYVALLCDRIGDVIGKFQSLWRAFRVQPTLISDESLKVFFPIRHWDSLRQISAGVDPLFYLSLIRQESGFNPHAISGVGALGLMQLMPSTARRMGLAQKRKLFVPEVNLKLGVRYFQNLVHRFSGNLDLALAAYNAGPERVEDWKRRYPTENRVLFMDLIPYVETRNYVALIDRNYFWYRKLYAKAQVARALAQSKTGSAATQVDHSR